MFVTFTKSNKHVLTSEHRTMINVLPIFWYLYLTINVVWMFDVTYVFSYKLCFKFEHAVYFWMNDLVFLTKLMTLTVACYLNVRNIINVLHSTSSLSRLFGKLFFDWNFWFVGRPRDNLWEKKQQQTNINRVHRFIRHTQRHYDRTRFLVFKRVHWQYKFQFFFVGYFCFGDFKLHFLFV